MKIITYATHRFGTFNDLIKSVPDIIVLGWGTKWTGFMDKFRGVLEYLESVPDDEIVMFVDGFDSIIKKDLGDVERIFKSMNCGVLVSRDQHDVTSYITRKIFTSCRNSIVNSGLYMGYAKYLKYMLKEALQSGEDDDQRALNMICSKVDFIKIDTDNIIFENCMNDRECIKNSDAFVVQTPGQYSVERYSRAVKEYSKYFLPEIILLCLIVFLICINKNV